MTQVGYDKRAIIVNNKRILLLSGAVHYARSTPQMWSQIMQRSREGGLNTIETYVFWSLHERKRGIFDFSERLDLYRFCQLAQEHGLYLILRIGPYICAETGYGGLPLWLRDVPDIQMRTYNEPFMVEMARWVRFLANYLKPLFAPNGGPIILAQIENEYNNIANLYGDSGQQYLAWAAQLAESLEVGIPWIMCKGEAPGIIETINDFYGHRQLTRHHDEHPDQPALWTEAWTGWYNLFGYPQHARTPQNMAYAVARFFAEGGAGLNYYMWHGGTNFNREAMYLQATSYNFDAPLDEFGLPTTKFNHLKRLHSILNEFAGILLEIDRPAHEFVGPEQIAFTYRSHSGLLTFLCNDSKQAANVAYAGLPYAMRPQSVLLLRDENILMDTAEVRPSDAISNVRLPSEMPLSWMSWAEPVPAVLSTIPDAALGVDTPVEQLHFTHDRTDYCWYTTRLIVAPAEAGKGNLMLERVADIAYVFVDGIAVTTSVLPLREQRGDINSDKFCQEFEIELAAGEHTVSILCCAVGIIKGDWMLGSKNMVEERKGLWGAMHWRGRRHTANWHIRPGLAGESFRVYAEGAQLIPWETRRKEVLRKHLTWWRTTFKHPGKDSLPLTVDLQGMGKGLAWLNGQCIGRYWLIPSVDRYEGWLKSDPGHPVINVQIGEATQRFYHLPAGWLQENNVLTLFEELDRDPGAARLTYGSPILC